MAKDRAKFLEELMAQKTAEATALQGQRDSARAAAKAGTSKAETLQETVTRLEREKAALTVENTGYGEQLAAAKSEITRYEGELSTAAIEYATVSDSLTEVRAELTDLKPRYEEAVSRNDAYREDVAKAEETTRVVAGKYDTAAAVLKALETITNQQHIAKLGSKKVYIQSLNIRSALSGTEVDAQKLVDFAYDAQRLNDAVDLLQQQTDDTD